MNDAIIIYSALIIAIIIGVFSKVLVFKHRKKQQVEYPALWNEFELIKDKYDYERIIEVGNKLIYNKFIPTKHLEIVHQFALEMENNHPEFTALRLNAYDKWIHHTRGHGNGF